MKGGLTPGSLRLLTVALLLLALLASVIARLGIDPVFSVVALAICGLAFVGSLLAFIQAIASPLPAEADPGAGPGRQSVRHPGSAGRGSPC